VEGWLRRPGAEGYVSRAEWARNDRKMRRHEILNARASQCAASSASTRFPDEVLSADGSQRINSEVKYARLRAAATDSKAGFFWNFPGGGAEYVTRVAPGRPIV
jgi:hypothetical protein